MNQFCKPTLGHHMLYFVRWQLWPILLSLPGHGVFVLRGLTGARVGFMRRFVLALQLIRIHLTVRCGHNPMELVRIVDEVLSLDDEVQGMVIECGTYQGGSTAKLTLAAALVNRQVIACDSFQGLPSAGDVDSLSEKEPFHEGQYAGQLELVRHNVARLGRLDVLECVEGWYEESLAKLGDVPVACAFLDVDLQQSIQTCVSAFWNHLSPGGKIFVHDVDRAPVVAPFRDRAWWSTHVAGPMPEFVGAGKGLGWSAPLLGYAVKDQRIAS